MGVSVGGKKGSCACWMNHQSRQSSEEIVLFFSPVDGPVVLNLFLCQASLKYHYIFINTSTVIQNFQMKYPFVLIVVQPLGGKVSVLTLVDLLSLTTWRTIKKGGKN